MDDKVFLAWAIDSRSPEGHGLLGKYYFAFGRDIPRSSLGCRVALFETRAKAREELNDQHYWPKDWKPRVVRVKVSIEVK